MSLFLAFNELFVCAGCGEPVTMTTWESLRYQQRQRLLVLNNMTPEVVVCEMCLPPHAEPVL